MYICADPQRRDIPIIDQKKKICIYTYAGSWSDPTKTDSSRFISCIASGTTVVSNADQHIHTLPDKHPWELETQSNKTE